MTFDDGLLDDEAALAPRRRAPALPRRGRCARTPRGGRRAGGASPRRCSASPTASPGPSWPPVRTRGCCAPCSSRSARCRSSPGPDRASPAGPAASTSSSCSRRRDATRPRPAPSPRPYGVAASWWSPAPEESLVAEHAQGRYATLLPTQTGDQLAIAVVVLDLLDRVHLGPQTDPEVVADALDEVAVVVRPAPGPRGEPGQDPGHRHRRLQPDASGAAPCSLPVRAAGSPSRSGGPPAAPHWPRTPSTCCPCSRRPPPADVFADPFADGGVERRPALVLLDDGSSDPAVARPGTGSRRPPGSTASGWRRSPRRPTATSRATRRCSPPAPTPRRTCRSGSAPDGPEHDGPPVPSRHVNRRWHQGGRRGAAGQHRHRAHEVRRVLLTGVLLDARRGDPLGGRLRQPAAAAARRPAGRRGGDAGAPLRLRPRALHLLVHRRDRAVHASAGCSRSTRRTTSTTRSTMHGHRTTRSARRPLVVGAARGAGHRDRAGVLLVPHGDHRDQQGSRASSSYWCSSSGGPRHPSCR